MVTIIVSFYITLPFELLIDNYYFNKGKRKLLSLNPTIIGISGSYGKTTLKNYLYDFLDVKYKVITPPGNINTPKGITKFINSKDFNKCDYFIVELGIDEIDGMKKFKRIISLDYAFITCIGDNHLSTFKTKNNIYKAKIKIVDLLKNKDNLFLNKNDPYLNKYDGRALYYDKLDAKISKINEKGLNLIYQNKLIQLKIFNEYSLLYLGVLLMFSKINNIKEKDYIKGIKNIKQIHRRQEVIKIKNGYLINDSYNSNVNSIKSSLKLLDSFIGVSYVIFSGLIEQGNNKISNEKEIKDVMKHRNIIFVGNKNHTFLQDVEFNDLIVVSNINEVYETLDKLNYNNVLFLPVGDRIHLN